MNLGVAPNPNPDGGNWTVLFGAFEEDEDDMDEQIGVVAVTDDADLPEVTEKEHRFTLWELSNEEAVVVYYGAALHRHGEDPEGVGCERFLAEEGETDLDDVPDDLRTCFEEVLEMEIYPPGEEPVDATRVLVEDVVDDEPNPSGGGMFY